MILVSLFLRRVDHEKVVQQGLFWPCLAQQMVNIKGTGLLNRYPPYPRPSEHPRLVPPAVPKTYLQLFLDTLGQTVFSARLMTANVTAGLNEVISATATPTPAAQMTIQHTAQGQLSDFGFTPRWLTQNAFADITVQNSGTVGADFRIEAIYANSFTTVSLLPFWTDGIGQRNYDINVISATDPVHLNSGQQAHIRINYKTPEGGQIPSGNITYYLTAKTSDGNYLEQMQTGHFGTTYEDTNGNVVAQSSLPTGMLDTQLPISSSLTEYGNSTICSLNISANNPYETPVLMDVAQSLPVGTTVLDANGGTINGNQILWQLNLQPGGTMVLHVTLKMPSAFDAQPLTSGTTASIYDNINAQWIDLNTSPSFIQVTNVPSPVIQSLSLTNGVNLSLRTFVPGAFQIQSTTNFVNWLPVATSTNVEGILNVNASASHTNRFQFYRAAKVQ